MCEHPIPEITHFINWADLHVTFRLACWPLHIFAQFMNWAENEQRFTQFVKWVRVI
jgi:predicted component of type VI protein secretion system